MGSLRSVSDFLTSPASGLTDAADRATARLLAATLLGITLVFVLVDLALWTSRPHFVPAGLGYLVLGVSYVVTRSGRYRTAAIVATLLFPLVSVSQLLLVPHPEPGHLVYSVLAPFFAGMFLGFCPSVVFAVLNPLWIGLLPLLSGGAVAFGSLINLLTVNLIGGMIAIAYAYRRTWTEQRRLDSQRLHEAQLMQMQKMEAIGRMAGGIAHDFNNLLTVISGGIELLERKGETKELKLIDNATKSARELTSQLLTLSRQGVVEHGSADLRRALRGAHQLLARILGEDIEIRVQVEEPELPVALTESQLQQVLLNLATNARDAMPRGGVLSFSAGSDGPDFVVLRVSDTGQGMDERTVQKVFEPFFTTKDVGKGTGLGLSMVFGIVTGAGGDVSVESKLGEGTQFCLRLRRADERDERAPRSDVQLELRGMAEGCILLIEDDSAVRQVCRSVLRREGYEVLEASDPDEGLRLFEEHRGRIELVISDIVMPKVSGLELVDRMQGSDPDLAVLFISGYAPEDVAGRSLDARLLLRKPFSPTELLRRVSSAVYGLESQCPPAGAPPPELDLSEPPLLLDPLLESSFPSEPAPLPRKSYIKETREKAAPDTPIARRRRER